MAVPSKQIATVRMLPRMRAAYRESVAQVMGGPDLSTASWSSVSSISSISSISPIRLEWCNHFMAMFAFFVGVFLSVWGLTRMIFPNEEAVDGDRCSWLGPFFSAVE